VTVPQRISSFPAAEHRAKTMMTLIDTLNALWHDWVRRSMPREVEGDDEAETD